MTTGAAMDASPARPLIVEPRLPMPPGVVTTPGRGEELRALFTAYAPRVGDAADAMAQTTVLGTSVDKATREMVRLRVARSVGCRTCMSGRWAVDGGRPLPDTVTGKIDDYERSDFAERQKVALRLADLYNSQPGHIDPDLRARAHEHYTTEQLVQIVLDLLRHSKAKLVAGLRVDVPQPQIFDYDDQGRNIFVEFL